LFYAIFGGLSLGDHDFGYKARFFLILDFNKRIKRPLSLEFSCLYFLGVSSTTLLGETLRPSLCAAVYVEEKQGDFVLFLPVTIVELIPIALCVRFCIGTT
jgi:hypothetical protein